MKSLLKVLMFLAGLAFVASEAAFGQDRSSPTAGDVVASVPETTLTVQSHQIGAGASAGNLEGASCQAPYTKMISGACHPFYSDQVTIINQFPNIPLNTWRCGFKNNTGSPVIVWIYTVCAKPEEAPQVTVRLINMIPAALSGETNQDSEPFLGIDRSD